MCKEFPMTTSFLQQDASHRAVICSSQHAQVGCCHAWTRCLHAWQGCVVFVHGTGLLSLCMGAVLSACMPGYSFVCSRHTCQPPLNSPQLLFHSSCLNPSPVSTLAMRLSASYPPAASNLSIAACSPSSAPLLPAQTARVKVLGGQHTKVEWIGVTCPFRV